MQPATVETLIEEANLQPDIALAIAKAFDIAIGGANLVTVAALDERFAKVDVRLAERDTAVEKRFGQLDASIAAAKQWALALVITLLGAVGGAAMWLTSRLDKVSERQDQIFAEVRAREDKILEQLQTLSAGVASLDTRVSSLETRVSSLEATLHHLQRPEPRTGIP